MSEYGLRPGSAEMQSAGPITFGPAGILFLADNVAAKVFAVDVADPGPAGAAEPFDLADVDARSAPILGCEAGDVDIRDMAVHPVIPQRVPVGAAWPRRGGPGRCWCGSTAWTAR